MDVEKANGIVPRALRPWLGAALILIVGTALAISFWRGHVILLDLSGLSISVWCL